MRCEEDFWGLLELEEEADFASAADDFWVVFVCEEPVPLLPLDLVGVELLELASELELALVARRVGETRHVYASVISFVRLASGGICEVEVGVPDEEAVAEFEDEDFCFTQALIELL